LPKKIAEDQKAQHERFIDTARALECDEDKERFEEKLGRIARAKSSQIGTQSIKPARHSDK
jgi:hypothetical protein